VPCLPGSRADISPRVCLRRAITCREATDRRYDHECEWHSRYGAGVTHQPDHSPERIKKKEPELKQVNDAVLQHQHPEHVEVEICRADEVAQRRGLTSELDEMWSYVGKKAEPRWLWHAIDHHSGTVLAYVFGRRKDEVFLQLQALREPFGITRFYTDGWGAYERHIDPKQHTIGKAQTQKIESKHINVRTRIKRLVRRTICFSKTTTMHDLVIGLFINRYEFGLLI
jgi:insertion element IS1 protein InsB